MPRNRTLLAELDQVGYFPEIVAEALETALGGEAPVAFYVQPDVAFGVGTIGRHLTVVLLTETRLISAHVDDHASDESGPAAVASSTEAVPLRRIQSVTLARITVQDPRPGSGDPPGMVRLSVDWGSNKALDLDPASCGDPECIADHGYSGSLSGEDLSLQAAAETGGGGQAAKLTQFARQLYATTARAA
ncbi:MAG: DUF5998 family protein [Bifidobacteriaceae bacterium]|jgi:hypothetical protein|nr:DUF5998 family protein [Bifidobacteriaceae bacterium]